MQGSPGVLRAEVLRSIESVDPFEWDGLAAFDGRSSHGWLLVTEECRLDRGARRYFVLRDERGIVAAAACDVQSAGSPEPIDVTLFGRFAGVARRLRLSVFPALVCGGVTGRGAPILVRPGTSGPQLDMIVERMLDELDAYARDRGWSLCVRGLDAPRRNIDARLDGRGFVGARAFPILRLDLSNFENFDEYRNHLRKVHPSTEQSIRNEANRAQRAGLRIERLADAVGDAAILHHLLDTHSRRRNGVPFPYRRDVFASLEKRLPERSFVWVVRDADRVIGVLVGVGGRDELDLPWVGVAADADRWGAPYFNLVFHAPIRDAIAARLQRINYGTLLYDTKVRRGCALVDVDIRVRGRSGLHTALLRPVLRAQRSRIARVTAGYPRHRDPA